MTRARRLRGPGALVLGMALLAAACGDGEMSMSEYGERVDAAASEASRRAELLITEASEVLDVEPEQIQAGLERGIRELRMPLQEAMDAIDPPPQIAELHDLMWDWHAEFISIEQEVAIRIGDTEDTAAGWATLSESPEMEAYRSSIAEGKDICNSLQARLDATAAAGDVGDTPWVPSEMKQVVEAALGCQWFPEEPDSIYRFPSGE